MLTEVLVGFLVVVAAVAEPVVAAVGLAESVVVELVELVELAEPVVVVVVVADVAAANGPFAAVFVDVTELFVGA